MFFFFFFVHTLLHERRHEYRRFFFLRDFFFFFFLVFVVLLREYLQFISGYVIKERPDAGRGRVFACTARSSLVYLTFLIEIPQCSIARNVRTRLHRYFPCAIEYQFSRETCVPFHLSRSFVVPFSLTNFKKRRPLRLYVCSYVSS